MWISVDLSGFSVLSRRKASKFSFELMVKSISWVHRYLMFCP